MPVYPYLCAADHETEVFSHMRDEKPTTVPCAFCGLPATRSIVLPIVRGDIPEHFNETLGEAVRGRAHLRTLQQVHGCQDFEPSGVMKDRLKESREKVLHGAGRGRVTIGSATHAR